MIQVMNKTIMFLIDTALFSFDDVFAHISYRRNVFLYLYFFAESFATKFESVENAKFIIHCRRLKSAIRAAKPKNR